MGRLISLNVGRPAERLVWQGRPVVTAIYKEPIAGPVMLRRLNADGDAQADLKSHGGPQKALYGYPSEHYAFWRGQFPDMEMPWGMFGENLTMEGLDEETVHIGDRFRVGAAAIEAVQPRYPCYKLALKFGRADMIRRFLESGRSGIYFSVAAEGMVEAGDGIELVHAGSDVSVRDIVRLAMDDEPDRDLVARALELPALPFFWKEQILERVRG